MKLLRINSVGSALRAILGWPALLLGIYSLTALTGSIFPANNGWQEPPDGIELMVETNGVHVSLIVPMQAAGEDLSDLIRPQDLEYPSYYGTHAMIGWGHEGVYQNAEKWADVRPSDIWDAATGSDRTLLHVYHRNNPQPSGIRRKFRVAPDQFRNIISEIRKHFKTDNIGHPIAYNAYGKDNVFYAANGRYNAFTTCNEWTASILRKAGVRVGVWTPMPGGVMRWFRPGDTG